MAVYGVEIYAVPGKGIKIVTIGTGNGNDPIGNDNAVFYPIGTLYPKQALGASGLEGALQLLPVNGGDAVATMTWQNGKVNGVTNPATAQDLYDQVVNALTVTSTSQSDTTPIVVGQQSVVFDARGYSRVYVSFFPSVDDVSNSVQVQISDNGTDWFNTQAVTYTLAVRQYLQVMPANYMRLDFVSEVAIGSGSNISQIMWNAFV